MRVVRSASGGTGPISDCIPVEPDTRYRLAASALWIDAESSAEGTVQLRIQFHQEASCAGTFLALGTGQVAIAPDEWQRIETVVDSPAGAVAALALGHRARTRRRRTRVRVEEERAR